MSKLPERWPRLLNVLRVMAQGYSAETVWAAAKWATLSEDVDEVEDRLYPLVFNCGYDGLLLMLQWYMKKHRQEEANARRHAAEAADQYAGEPAS